jgi:trans-aconitate methyltransferase
VVHDRLWDERFTATTEADRSWTQPVPTDSLEFIALAGVGPDDAVIDVGGGASRLVDELLARGFTDVSVLDLSTAALDEAEHRLGGTDPRVHWIHADVTHLQPSRTYRLWHDRAVFHFLTDDVARTAYRRNALASVEPGGHLVLATFAPDGPEQCSGLPVLRWDAEGLASEFDGFELVASERREHHTPWGSVQPFTWVLLRRLPRRRMESGRTG